MARQRAHRTPAPGKPRGPAERARLPVATLLAAALLAAGLPVAAQGAGDGGSGGSDGSGGSGGEAGATGAGLESPDAVEVREPIRIDGDADLDAAHGVRGGSGTAEDPFLIAGWRITSPGVQVRVANTTKALVLRNLALEGTCDPLRDGDACALEAGIHAHNVTGPLVVVHNAITGMERAGISLERVRGPAEVVANRIQGGGGVLTGTGILVRTAQDVEVRGNDVIGVAPAVAGEAVASAGMRVWDSERVLLAGNVLRDNAETGVNLLHSRDVLLEDNIVEGSVIGVAAQGFAAVLRHNDLHGNTGHDVVLERGGLVLERNVLEGSRKGLSLGNGTTAELRGNVLQGHTEWAMALHDKARASSAYDYWGHASGPDVDGQGPGSGSDVALVRAAARQLHLDAWLASPPTSVGAHAPRDDRRVVASTAAGQGGEGGPGGAGSGSGAGDGDARRASLAAFEGPGEVALEAPARFSAARAHDPDGMAITAYRWDLGDGTSKAGLGVTHAFAETGEYLVRLVTETEDGRSASSAIKVRVVREPLGVALEAPLQAFRGEPFELRATATGQPLAGMDQVRFRFTDGGPGSFGGAPQAAATEAITLDGAPGDRLMGVEATAGDEVAMAFVLVEVPNRPPEDAKVRVEPEGRGTTATTFRLAASAHDPDGDPLAYRWETGGGQQGDGPLFEVSFARSGTHVVELTVGDGYAAITERVALEVDKRGVAADGAGSQEGPRPAPGAPVLGLLFAVALGVAVRHGKGRAPQRRNGRGGGPK